jgi:hypothetical protein
MPISITCPHCEAKGSAPEKSRGHRCRCPKCGDKFTVPLKPIPVLEAQPAIPVLKAQRVSHRKKGFPFWILALLIPVLCCGLPIGMFMVAKISDKLAPVDEHNMGEEIRFGDLGVTVTQAQVSGYSSRTAAGRLMNHTPEFVIHTKFKNYNPKRVVKAGSQVRSSTLVDDVGNSYQGIRATNEIGLTNEIEGQISPGMAIEVRSDEPATDVLVFDRPVQGASFIFLTLDASKYGGSGKVRIKIPKSAWSS